MHCAWAQFSVFGNISVFWRHNAVCMGPVQCVWEHFCILEAQCIVHGPSSVCLGTFLYFGGTMQCVWAQLSMCGHIAVFFRTLQSVWSEFNMFGHIAECLV